MLVRNTYQTLFKVTETGLELVADFVTRSDAEEWAKQNQVLSYCLLETVVQHEVTIQTRIEPARAIRLPEGKETEDLGIEGSADRKSQGPVKDARKSK